MAKLNVEALKRRLTQYHYAPNDLYHYEYYAVRATDMNEAMAALEDRDD